MKIKDLQQKLKDADIDAYLVNHSNMFIKQDILDDENKILELTGFSGSNGLLLVFQTKAVLLVDGRYEIQAKNEVKNKKITVFCTKLYPTSNAIAPFIKGKADSLMYNPWCFTESTIRHMQNAFPDIKMIEDNKNMLGNLSTDNIAEVFEHKLEFAGIESKEKIQILTTAMQKHCLDYYLMCDASSVSWMLNLRSDLLPNTPILRAYALVKNDGSFDVFSENLKGINYKNFSELEEKLLNIGEVKVGVDLQYTPKKIISILKKKTSPLNNPIALAKSKKSPIEMAGFEKAHIRDGVALTKFLFWLEQSWMGKTELDIVSKLLSFRRQQENFFSNSFDTIAAYGENAAIVHYSPSDETNKTLHSGNVLLLDSGAQYFDGTTDVTRTVAIGNITNTEIIDRFTLVLKAHIALASTIFPINTRNIDCIARRELWRLGLEYKHGSGHGVGYFSGVHEMPPSLSESGSGLITENMVLSIEPGYYKEDNYGIRIENLVKTVLLKESPFSGCFLKFEPLTLAPIDKRLINKYLLNKDELDYLNNYHSKVLEKLRPYMTAQELSWLEDSCSPL